MMRSVRSRRTVHRSFHPREATFLQQKKKKKKNLPQPGKGWEEGRALTWAKEQKDPVPGLGLDVSSSGWL